MGDRQARWALFDDQSRYVDRFGLLIMITAAAVVTLSLFDMGRTDSVGSDLGLLAVTVFVGATLLLSLRASGVARRYRLMADIIIGVGLVVTTLAVAYSILIASDEVLTAPPRSAGPSSVWIVLSVFAPLFVIRRLVHHRRASAQTLLGAVSAYLLLALAFNFVYLTIDASGEPFFGRSEPTTSFMYYSLVTITTLGYGDLAAVSPLGRLLSTVEAVIGQVYLVTFVGMIVGLLVGQRQRPHRETRADS